MHVRIEIKHAIREKTVDVARELYYYFNLYFSNIHNNVASTFCCISIYKISTDYRYKK